MTDFSGSKPVSCIKTRQTQCEVRYLQALLRIAVLWLKFSKSAVQAGYIVRHPDIRRDDDNRYDKCNLCNDWVVSIPSIGQQGNGMEPDRRLPMLHGQAVYFGT